MNRLLCRTYMDDVQRIGRYAEIAWEKFEDKTLLISGITGLIGTFLADVIMFRNCECGQHICLVGISRNEATMRERFADYLDRSEFRYISHDISQPLTGVKADYIIHAASNTHPLAYAAHPIDTIMTNVSGCYHLLNLAAEQNARFLLMSSVEIYGENRGDTDYFSEDYTGILKCNTMRAGYPESKRVSETLCQAFIKEKNADCVILRLSRIFGPTVAAGDSKASSQFIQKAVQGEDIVLKSAGTQLYSYTYVADTILAVLLALQKGETGEAYNVASPDFDIQLKDFAGKAAELCGRKVVFELPSEQESAGFSTATKAIMDGEKIKTLGWKPLFTFAESLQHTVEILRELEK